MMNPYSLSEPLPEKPRHAARSRSARTSENDTQTPAKLPSETPPRSDQSPATASFPHTRSETPTATTLPQLAIASLYPIATAMHATASAHCAKTAPFNTF